MKKVIFAVISMIAMVSAFAGTPTSVKDANGIVWGTEQALSVEKDTSSGNRVKIKYSSGFQYAVDNAAWSVYAALKAGLTKPVDVPSSITGLSYDIAKSNGIGCNLSNASTISWPNVSMGESVADNCGFRTAAQAASN
jgi:hypothetical protein